MHPYSREMPLELIHIQKLSASMIQIDNSPISEEEKQAQHKELVRNYLMEFEGNIQYLLDNLDIKKLYSLRDVLLTPERADDFLIGVLSYNANSDSELAQQEELVKEAIALGANVNKSFSKDIGIQTPISLTKGKDNLTKLLQEHGAVCGLDSDIAQKFLHEHQAIFDSQKVTARVLDSLKAQPQDIAKIPYIMHHVWLTHPNSPRELFAEDIAIVLKNAEEDVTLSV